MGKTEGLIAAPYTPYDKKGNVNIDLIPAYADYLKKSGVRGVFVNGTTGEGASLTVTERMLCAEAWIAQKDQQFRVIVHVGHNSLSVARKLAVHAGENQADAFGLIAPNYFKPDSLAALVATNADVAAAAPQLPYYYYHMPAATGAYFPMIGFLKQAEEKIPNLAGIKFTHEDLMEYKLCLEYGDRKFDILHGRDEILICGLVLGARGAIGSTYNYLAPVFVRMIEAFENADLVLANELQFEAMKIMQVLQKYGGAVKAGKSFMRLVGFDFGNPRLPVAGLNAKEESLLENELHALGFEKVSRVV